MVGCANRPVHHAGRDVYQITTTVVQVGSYPALRGAIQTGTHDGGARGAIVLSDVFFVTHL